MSTPRKKSKKTLSPLALIRERIQRAKKTLAIATEDCRCRKLTIDRCCGIDLALAHAISQIQAARSICLVEGDLKIVPAGEISHRQRTDQVANDYWTHVKAEKGGAS